MPEHLPSEHLDQALLGLVLEHPMHAYEMYQRLQQTEPLHLVWRLKQSHLYALIARLEAAGYLTSTTQTQGTRPPRRVLRLTPQGRETFERWVVAPVEHGRDLRLEFLAKLYFAQRLGQATVAALLAAQRAACDGWLAELDARAAALDTARTFDRLVLGFRGSQLRAMRSWLDDCERELLP